MLYLSLLLYTDRGFQKAPCVIKIIILFQFHAVAIIDYMNWYSFFMHISRRIVLNCRSIKANRLQFACT